MRDEIIRMAKEVGFEQISPLSVGTYICFTDEIERFYNLAVLMELEKVATWIMQRGYATGHGDTVEDLLKELEWQVREHEREQCAKVCDEVSLQAVVSWKLAYHPEDQGREMGADECAHAIRARGEKT